MTKALTNRILEILQGSPYGLTTNEIASRLAANPSNINSRLSKLVAYGIIKRTRGKIVHDAAPCAIYHVQIPAHSTTVWWQQP